MPSPEPLTLTTDDGVDLAAEIIRPWRPTTGLRPGVVITGPFSAVKEQVVATYARRLTDAGIVALTLDHRGFGGSGGRRGHEDSGGKLTDLRAGVSALAADEEVDPGRLGVVGICLGGGYAMRAAASDPRLRSAVGIAGGYNSPADFAAGMGVENYRAALAGFLERYTETMPAVAPYGGEAAMGGDEPWEYYGTLRGAAGLWENKVTRGSLHSLMTFDALGAADLLGATPTLIVHGRVDAYCAPELAQKLYDRIPGTAKRIEWLDTTCHVDLYDNAPFVRQAVDLASAHLTATL